MSKSRLKWLPVINEASCTGCNKCIEACGAASLVLIDNVSTLVDPATCGSESHCIPVCPEACIEMKWLDYAGTESAGIFRWSTDADYSPPPLPY